MLGFFTYLLNIQGNIVPFLKSELHLSYRIVSLHSSALAAGLLVTGLVGERVLARLGRRRTVWLGAAGVVAGTLIVCAARSPWISIAGFAANGMVGGLVPMVVVAVIADIPASRRAVAFAEANAMSYAFAIMAPLLMGASVALALDWRTPQLIGVAIGVAILFMHRRTPLADPPSVPLATHPPLPAAYWAFWILLALGVSMEFCVHIWSPEFLEQVAGFSKAGAAAAAAAFFAAMLLGRLAGSGLVRVVAPPALYVGALVVAVGGFAVYWGLSGPAAAVAGLAILGLGIAQFYPLTAGFAMHAAGAAGDKASARLMTAVGLAIFSTPAIMGVLADEVGLRLAHLVLPVLMAAATVCFLVAMTLQHRQAPGASL
jgi:fucose permease